MASNALVDSFLTQSEKVWTQRVNLLPLNTFTSNMMMSLTTVTNRDILHLSFPSFSHWSSPV